MADRDGLIDDALAKVSELGTVGAMKWLASELKASPQPAPHAMSRITESEARILRESMQRFAVQETKNRARDLIDVLAQPAAVEPATVPKGWKLVPVEPTDEMIKVVRNSFDWEEGDPEDHRYSDGYGAAKALCASIIAAAPSPAVAEPARKAIDAQGEEYKFEFIGYNGKSCYRIFDNSGNAVCYAENPDQAIAVTNLLCASPLPAATLGKEPADIKQKRRRLIMDGLQEALNSSDGITAWMPSEVVKAAHDELAQQPAASDVRDAVFTNAQGQVVTIGQIALWFEEAAQQIADWGAYASGHFQQKHGLDNDVKLFKHRAEAIREYQSTPAVHAKEQP